MARTKESLERALREALRLGPFGLNRREVQRIWAMAEDDWEPPKESKARRLLTNG